MGINYNAALPAVAMEGKSKFDITQWVNELKSNLGAVIKQMFAGGEQGFAYDINDLSTLFQDAAGTIPVTGAGQPVGLMLDKSKGLVLGSEKWSDPAAFFVGGSSRVGTNTYRIYTLDTTYSAVYISNVLTIGKLYKLTFNIDSITQLGMGISIEGIPTTVFTTTGKKSVYFFASTTTAAIKRASSACDFQISNISIKEIAGNHAYQANAAPRPLLQRNPTTGAYYLAFDGSDDFLVTNSINFTSTDKVSLFAGVRKLSDAQVGSILSLAGSNGIFELYTPSMVGANNYVLSATGSTGVKYLNAEGYVAPHSAVLAAKIDIGQDLRSLSANGTKIQNSTVDLGTGNFGNYQLYIGRRGGTSLPFNGHIYSLIGVGRIATGTEISAIEKVLAKQLGVTLP